MNTTIALPNGDRLEFLDRVISEDAPPIIREAHVRLAIVNHGGTCPCGVAFVMPSRELRCKAAKAGRGILIDIEHAVGCPASTVIYRAAMKADGAI